MSTVNGIFLIANGQLEAARNAVKGTPLDVRGGWANEFPVDLVKAAPGGPPHWQGAYSWTMERSGLLTVSFELFVEVVIGANTAVWNIPGAACQYATYLHGDDPGDDFDLSVTSAEAWAAALADSPANPVGAVAKKPDALELVT